jgi:putative Holliday junction resolvase
MTEETSQTVLGVDVGTRRVGVAVSDEGCQFALPHATFDSSDAPERIVELARERGSTLAVVGWPLELDGSEGRATRNVTRFIERLEKAADDAQIELEIATYDERLTTSAAHNLLGEAAVYGARRKAVVDQVAATQILQNYLDEHH